MKYFVINPGGNITALVKFHSSLDKIKINDLIMKKDQRVEQVGFFTVDINKKKYYLEMAGDEFCGNATRSFAFLISTHFNKNLKNIYIQNNVFKEKILCRVNKKSTSLYFPINQIRTDNDFICIGNTAHQLSTNDKEKIKINNKYEASGLIKYEKHRENVFEIKPQVYVKKINTLFNETSCLSGSIALYHKYKFKENIKIIQPSKNILNIKKSKDRKYLIISGLVTY